jgi:S1-C subfamily serine protease
MRTLLTTIVFLAAIPALVSCQPPDAAAGNEPSSAVAENPEDTIIADAQPADTDLTRSVVRLRSTTQSWSAGQPWEKNEPEQRRALAAIVGPARVVTTAEMVGDATFLEFESPDGTRFAEAVVVAVDYEANLALLAPADDDSAGAALFADTEALEIAAAPSLGDRLEVLQVEENGLPLVTVGFLQSIGVSSNFLAGQNFLTFFIKASMQSAASSYSLPVLRDGKLAAILLSYNSDDQIIDATATDILARFLEAASEAETTGTAYQGFPGLGVVVARTEDPAFREFLGLGDDHGGVYVGSVRDGSAAANAGIRKGDVVLAVDGLPIDRRGFYQHPNYGGLFWGHMVRGEKSIGDIVAISILRDGEPIEIQAELTREEESTRLVPSHRLDLAPNYLVKGGLVFQELTRPLLEAFGREWQSRAPLNLLDVIENPEKYEDRFRRVVFLSGTIATPATVGYEGLRNLIVTRVNGRDIQDMATLVEAFEQHDGPLHSIEFLEEDFTVHLDEAVTSMVDAQLLQRGIPRLSRTDGDQPDG